jgi:hypothetical protein
LVTKEVNSVCELTGKVAKKAIFSLKLAVKTRFQGWCVKITHGERIPQARDAIGADEFLGNLLNQPMGLINELFGLIQPEPMQPS